MVEKKKVNQKHSRRMTKKRDLLKNSKEITFRNHHRSKTEVKVNAEVLKRVQYGSK